MGRSEVQVLAEAPNASRALAGAHRASSAVAVRPLAPAVWTRPNNGSRMTQGCHVRFCESAEVQSLRATHLVMGFEKEADARRMMADLRDRLAKFGLSLHEDKTRLIEFGRFAASTRARRGERRPETFAFLGFTHYCGRTRDGRFIVKHKTQSRRLTRKLAALRPEARRLTRRPPAEQHRWRVSVLSGHYAYFGMPHNWRALNGFLREVRRIWFNCLRRRSQKTRPMPWSWFEQIGACFPLPQPRITYPWTPRAA